MTGKSGWLLAGALLVAMGSTAHAQVGISIGNPYNGRGVVVGTPGYGYGYGAYNPVYGPNYYNSGYAGYAPVVGYTRPYVVPNYGYRPYNYGYGYRPYRRGYRRW